MTRNPGETWTILAWALLNPVVVLVAAWLGRKADQWQKVAIAAFGGAISGVVTAAIGQNLGLINLLPRSFAGIFVAASCLAVVAAAVGYATRRT